MPSSKENSSAIHSICRLGLQNPVNAGFLDKIIVGIGEAILLVDPAPPLEAAAARLARSEKKAPPKGRGVAWMEGSVWLVRWKS